MVNRPLPARKMGRPDAHQQSTLVRFETGLRLPRRQPHAELNLVVRKDRTVPPPKTRSKQQASRGRFSKS